MQILIRPLFVLTLACVAQLAPAQSVFMVLEQDADGDASHRALDLTPIGDGLDPVLQFILLNEPDDPQIAQVLWETSETPIPWVRAAEEQDYHFVEYAVLPEGARIEYRIYLSQFDLELTPLRHSRTPEDDTFGLDASIFESLPNAEYDIHAHLIVPDRPEQVMKQRINVVDFAEIPEVVLDEEPEEPETPTLEPGDGFRGETPPPAQVGDSTNIAIAEWNVVSQRQIAGQFQLGVVAHHINGIDHVAISLDGGPWLKVEQPSINPRTGSEEYWATLDATGKTGWHEVRAIAVPTEGMPRLLKTMRLYAGENDKLFPEIVLQAGTYKVGQLTRGLGSHDEGWVTIRAAEGVSRDQVIIIGNATGGRDRHLRFKGITRKLGQWDEHYGDKDPEAWWWFDDCSIQGNTRSRWIVHHSARQYYTDTTITDFQTTFQNAWLLARNVVIERGWEDICRSFGMMVNVTINKLDRGDFDSYHPDLFQWYQSDVNNFIAQDVSSPNNVGQGLFSGDIKNSAFVRMNITTRGTYVALHMLGKTRNVLIKDCAINGPGYLRYDKGFEPDDLVFRDSKIGSKAPHLPAGWKHKEIKVYPALQAQGED